MIEFATTLEKITVWTRSLPPIVSGAAYLCTLMVLTTTLAPAAHAENSNIYEANASALEPAPSATVASMQDDDGNSALIEFDPIIYTAILDGKPYLQVTVKVIGKITPGLNTVTYHDQKNQMAAAMLTIVARLAKKKFRIGKPLDPDMIVLYLQAAVNRSIKNKTAVKIFIVQAEQKPLQ